MVGGQRDQPRLLIHLPGDVNGSDAAILADIEQADFDALLRQRHPRINVGGIIVEINQNVVALAPRQAGGDVTQGQRSGADQGDFLRLRAQKPGGEFACAPDLTGGNGFLLIVQRGARRLVAHGFGHTTGQRTDGSMGQKNFLARNGEFVPAQFFVGEDFRDGHFRTCRYPRSS